MRRVARSTSIALRSYSAAPAAEGNPVKASIADTFARFDKDGDFENCYEEVWPLINFPSSQLALAACFFCFLSFFFSLCRLLLLLTLDNVYASSLEARRTRQPVG